LIVIAIWPPLAGPRDSGRRILAHLLRRVIRGGTPPRR